MNDNLSPLARRRLDFLNEGLEFYKADPTRRALNPEHELDTLKPICLYRAPNGNRCMIGRYIPDDKYDPEMESMSPNNKLVKTALPEEINSLGEDFLSKCQDLHDNSRFWDKDGLTLEGEEQYNRLIRLYVQLS